MYNKSPLFSSSTQPKSLSHLHILSVLNQKSTEYSYLAILSPQEQVETGGLSTLFGLLASEAERAENSSLSALARLVTC